MRLTDCIALIWNLECRSLITTTNYLNYFKVVTTCYKPGSHRISSHFLLVSDVTLNDKGIYMVRWKLTILYVATTFMFASMISLRSISNYAYIRLL